MFFFMGVYYTIKNSTEVCGHSAVVSISPSMLQNKSTNLQDPLQALHSVKFHHHFTIILGDVACGENYKDTLHLYDWNPQVYILFRSEIQMLWVHLG